jgi:hypothetical protein
MESPEAFLLRFFAARNVLFRRHQMELETFQKGFCQGVLVYDKRIAGYEEERILDVVRQGSQVDVTTTGSSKGKNAFRMRYELVAPGDTWVLSDLKLECPVCRGSGKSRSSKRVGDVPDESKPAMFYVCKACKGLGWISMKKAVEGLSEG